MKSSEQERTLHLDDAARINSLREEFERAWKTGAEVRLEDFLSRTDESIQAAAFRELLSTEIKLRKSRLENISIDEYLGRFSSFAEVIRDTFSKGPPPSAGKSEGRRRTKSGLHVRCPHCHSPIELVPDAELDSVHCDSCGSNFSLTTDGYDATRSAPGIAEVGHFRLIERLGMGAFGTVWKAQDIELDRTVALKIPRSGQLDRRQQEYFLREARSAAQLRHSNIVPVYEVGRDGDTLYIVSQYVRGIDLSDWLTTRKITARESAELCETIAGALHHAHEQGVIHRDLKPANVMIDGEGTPHLMDFGLARRDAGEITMTVDGQVIGTPAFMSPEQAQGEAHTADRRSDVYSLGVMLFQMLTGELPFRGNSRMLMHQVIHDDPPSPRKLNATIPRDLETIVLKCLE